jgi:hypothetical protein
MHWCVQFCEVTRVGTCSRKMAGARARARDYALISCDALSSVCRFFNFVFGVSLSVHASFCSEMYTMVMMRFEFLLSSCLSFLFRDGNMMAFDFIQRIKRKRATKKGWMLLSHELNKNVPLQFQGNLNVEWGQDKAESCDKLNQNVKRWAHGVLERVTDLQTSAWESLKLSQRKQQQVHRVASDGCFVRIGSFPAMRTTFDVPV